MLKLDGAGLDGLKTDLSLFQFFTFLRFRLNNLEKFDCLLFNSSQCSNIHKYNEHLFPEE